MLKRQKAQSLGEYVLVLMIVLSAVAAMTPMLRRGTQSLIRVGADQIGVQKDAEQNFEASSSYTENMASKSSGNSLSRTREFSGTWGKEEYEQTFTKSNSLTNMGFTASTN